MNDFDAEDFDSEAEYDEAYEAAYEARVARQMQEAEDRFFENGRSWDNSDDYF